MQIDVGKKCAIDLNCKYTQVASLPFSFDIFFLISAEVHFTT